MSRNGRRLLATLLLAFVHTGVDAEIDRVSLEGAAVELSAAKRAITPDMTEFSLPLNDLVSKVPDMARVVLPEDAKPKSRNIRAIFAVRRPGGEVRHSKAVRMEWIDGRTYCVARRSKRTFRSWLLKRIEDLMQESVVLEDIVGLEPDGVSFYLSVADVAEELFAVADAQWESDRPERALEQQISGTSIIEGVFGDLEGGSRRFSEFEERTLLLHIWATWCAPCIAEMPALQKLQDRYRGHGLTVINLSDEPADVIRDWVSENPSTMVHGRVDGFEILVGDSPPEGVDRGLGSRPVYVIVDREGIARNVGVGFRDERGFGTPKAVPEGESEHPAAAWLKPYLPTFSGSGTANSLKH